MNDCPSFSYEAHRLRLTPGRAHTRREAHREGVPHLFRRTDGREHCPVSKRRDALNIKTLQGDLAREVVEHVRIGLRAGADSVCLGARSETGRLCLSFGGDLSGLGASSCGSDNLVRVCVGLCLRFKKLMVSRTLPKQITYVKSLRFHLRHRQRPLFLFHLVAIFTVDILLRTVRIL